MSKETKVIVHGLNEEQAKEFVNWYASSGEADFCSWVEDGEIEVPSLTDTEATLDNNDEAYIEEDGCVHLFLTE